MNATSSILLVASAVAVLARVAPLVAVAPFGALMRLPTAAQPALVAAISAWVLFSLPGAALAHTGTFTWGDLFGAVAMNAVVGAVFAFVARLLYSAFEIAGGYLDVVFGFSLSATLAPTGADSTVVQVMLMMLGTVLFLTLGGLTDMIAALAASFRSLPAFAPIHIGPGVLTSLLDAFTAAVGVAVAVCAPLILTMVLVNLLVGALGRLIPQINLIAFDFPLLMLIGVVLLAVSMPMWLGVAQTLLSDLGSAISALAGAV